MYLLYYYRPLAIFTRPVHQAAKKRLLRTMCTKSCLVENSEKGIKEESFGFSLYYIILYYIIFKGFITVVFFLQLSTSIDPYSVDNQATNIASRKSRPTLASFMDKYTHIRKSQQS